MNIVRRLMSKLRAIHPSKCTCTVFARNYFEFSAIFLDDSTMNPINIQHHFRSIALLSGRVFRIDSRLDTLLVIRRLRVC